VEPVITVQKENPLAVTVRKNPIESGISGCGQASIGLVDYFDSGILGGIFITNRRTLIRRTIIYQHQFKVCKSLQKSARERYLRNAAGRVQPYRLEQ
jgi:hypothetical protein